APAPAACDQLVAADDGALALPERDQHLQHARLQRLVAPGRDHLAGRGNDLDPAEPEGRRPRKVDQLVRSRSRDHPTLPCTPELSAERCYQRGGSGSSPSLHGAVNPFVRIIHGLPRWRGTRPWAKRRPCPPPPTSPSSRP